MYNIVICIYIYTRIESPINPDLLNCHLVCMCCSTSSRAGLGSREGLEGTWRMVVVPPGTSAWLPWSYCVNGRMEMYGTPKPEHLRAKNGPWPGLTGLPGVATWLQWFEENGYLEQGGMEGGLVDMGLSQKWGTPHLSPTYPRFIPIFFTISTAWILGVPNFGPKNTQLGAEVMSRLAAAALKIHHGMQSSGPCFALGAVWLKGLNETVVLPSCYRGAFCKCLLDIVEHV